MSEKHLMKVKLEDGQEGFILEDKTKINVGDVVEVDVKTANDDYSKVEGKVTKIFEQWR